MFRRCERCRARNRHVRAKLIDQGLCCCCKQPSDSGVYCAACILRRTEAAQKRRELQVLAPYRAVVILDRSTAHLAPELRRVGFRAYTLELCGSKLQRQAMLAQRVLITRWPSRLRLAAIGRACCDCGCRGS